MIDVSTRQRPAPLTGTPVKFTGMLNEYELSTSVAEALEARSLYCLRLMAELHYEGYITIQQTMNMMVAVDLTVQYPEPYGSLWRQFSINFMADFLDIMAKGIRAGSYEIFKLTDRNLWIPPVPPVKAGIVRRFFEALFRKGTK